MKRVGLFLFTILFVIICFTGCSNHFSSYHAVGLVRSGDSDSARMSFIEFEGTEVFKLKIESGKTAKIKYSGKLEMGSLTVYYDCGETKTELFSIHSGDEINAYSELLSSGTVYVIIETSEKCENGNLGFEINYD